MSENQPDKQKPLYGLNAIIQHPVFGQGRIIALEKDSYQIQFKGGDRKRVAFSFTNMESIEAGGDPETDRIKQAVREVLGDHGWLDADLEMNARWLGGVVKLIPGKEDTGTKEIPIETFFKKIISVREKLRVLEQKINNHPKLNEIEKAELEGYLTRSYGSLTSFNVLFNTKEGQFKGQGKDS